MNKQRKPGDRVMTSKGTATIGEDKEFYSRLSGGMYRYEVYLDNNPFPFNPFFFQDEMTDA
jgi:hypothetical protein